MKIWAFLFLLFAYSYAPGQKSFTCNCKGFVDTSFKGNITLFEKTGGKPVSQVSYLHKKGNYLLFDIDQVADSFFYVRMNYTLTGESFRGWIRKSVYLVTGLNTTGAEIILYAEPGAASKIRYHIPGPASGNYQIFNCSKSWMFIKGPGQKPLSEGWLQTNDQCAHPVSKCE